MKEIKELQEALDRLVSGQLPITEYVELEIEKLTARFLLALPLESILRIKQQLKASKESKLDSKAIGKIVHQDSRIPIANLEVELYDRDPFGIRDYLGRGETGKNGEFEIYYSSKDAGFGDAPDLELRIFEPIQTTIVDGEISKKRNLIEVIKGDDNVRVGEYNFGIQEILYYEYDTYYSQFPYSQEGSLKHNFVPKALAITQQAVAKYIIPTNKIIQENIVFPNKPTYEEIQNRFPTNVLTLELEKTNPGYTRSDEFFGDRMLNGFHPTIFKKDRNNPDLYVTSFNGETFELTGKTDLPNYKVKLKLENDRLLPVEITLQFREDNRLEQNPPMKEPQTYTPEDGNRWLQAKRVVRATYLGVLGEVKWHLGFCHFNMEQYALSFFRNIRKNPIRNFLYPHIKEVVHINDFGRDILVDPNTGFFAELEPMLVKSSQPEADMLSWVRSSLGTYDWTNWQPLTPICDSHNYAKIGNLYWKILTTHTDEFFAANRDEIIKNWDEIIRFSEELVKYSVPYRPLSLEQVKDDDPWYDLGEIGDNSAQGRVTIDGVLKAIRPIATSENFKEADLANLKQVCRYIIYVCTFSHTWIHIHQKDELGEIKYGTLLRNGSMGDEDDENVLPGQRIAALILGVNHMLDNFKYGYMLKNEDGDVPPRLIELLTNKKTEFEQLGFDLNLLRSRLNS